MGIITSVSIRDLVTAKPETGKGKADKAKSKTAERQPDIKPEIIPASESFTAETPPITAPIYSAQSDSGIITESGSSIELAIPQNMSSKIIDDTKKNPCEMMQDKKRPLDFCL
jgi:hypothetical protein